MAKGKAKPPVSTEELVRRALRLAATSSGNAKWLAKSAQALFNEKEPNTAAAIEHCLNPERPLLRQLEARGHLTPAGFEEVSADLGEEDVVPVARAIAATLAPGERASFLQSVIGRTPCTAPDLVPLLEEAVTAEKAEAEKRVAEAAARRERDKTTLEALDRAKQVIVDFQRARVESLLSELRAEGFQLQAEVKRPAAERGEPTAEPRPKTPEDGSFRRQMARRMVSSWLQQWQADRHQGREAMETALGGMSGIRRIGNTGETVPFDGGVHECERVVPEGTGARVKRPGWQLVEEEGPYTLLKALVE